MTFRLVRELADDGISVAVACRPFAPRKNNSPPTAASPTPGIKAKAPGVTVGRLSRCGR